jgi:hypothetical protein
METESSYLVWKIQGKGAKLLKIIFAYRSNCYLFYACLHQTSQILLTIMVLQKRSRKASHIITANNCSPDAVVMLIFTVMHH